MLVKNPLVTNTLKKKTLSFDSKIWTTGNIFSYTQFIPMIPDLDELSQSFLKIDLEMTATTSNFDCDYLAYKIFQDIILETYSGVKVMQLKPEYHIYKHEKLSGTPLFDLIESGMNPPFSWNNINPTTTSGACTLYIPLHFFYSADSESYFKIRHIEPLRLRLTTNSSENIGMLTAAASLLALTKITASLVQESFNTEASETKFFLLGQKYPESLVKNSYDVFYEDQVTLLSGTTSKTVLLRCMYPCVNILGTIFKQNTRVKINSYSLRQNATQLVGDSITQISTLLDYNLSNTSVSFIQNKNLEHYFNKKHTVLSNTGLTTFSGSDNNFPTYLTVTYDSLSADSVLYLFSEYPTHLLIDENKRIVPNDTDSVISRFNSVLSK